MESNGTLHFHRGLRGLQRVHLWYTVLQISTPHLPRSYKRRAWCWLFSKWPRICNRKLWFYRELDLFSDAHEIDRYRFNSMDWRRNVNSTPVLPSIRDADLSHCSPRDERYLCLGSMIDMAQNWSQWHQHLVAWTLVSRKIPSSGRFETLLVMKIGPFFIYYIGACEWWIRRDDSISSVPRATPTLTHPIWQLFNARGTFPNSLYRFLFSKQKWNTISPILTRKCRRRINWTNAVIITHSWR